MGHANEAQPRARAEALLGLGSNLGDRRRNLADAVRRLTGVVEALAISSVYRSQPVGFADQPDFLNLVLLARTPLGPYELLDRLQEIEHVLGRERTFPNAPRTIDLDILAYDDAVIRSDRLTIPHPRLHSRGFVLHPLAEIVPGWRHPVLGVGPAELIRRAGELEWVEREEPLRSQP